MMLSLFSIFDPSSGWYIISNWMVFSLPLLFFYPVFPSSFNYLILKIVKMYLYTSMKPLLGSNSMLFYIYIPLFILILTYNLLGLFPFVFSLTSHLVFSISLSLFLWFSLMMLGWINHTKDMFSHLVPLGCPAVLMPFMVMIESISLLIRPITLAIRLAANIVAGHMILSLVCLISYNNILTLVLTISTECALMILEIFVAFIQPYVFFILFSLYSEELPL